MYSFRILENYSKDMFHSSIIRFDKASYLFNCCDGTQRNALDQGIKFPKIKSIFFNSSQIDCYLGCYGFLMSRGEMNISRAFSIAQNIVNKNDDDEKSNKNNSKQSKNEDNKNIKDKEKNNKEKNKKKKRDKSPDKKVVIKPILNKINETDYKNPFEEIQQCSLFGPPNFSQNFKDTQNFCPVPINNYLYEYDISSNSFICRNIFKEKNVSEPIKLYI